MLWKGLHGLYPCDDFGVISSFNKDNNGGDQIEDGRYEGSEEILLRGREKREVSIQSSGTIPTT